MTGYVYIVTNRKDGTLYIGVTNNLIRRPHEHRMGLIKGFTSKYNCKILVYYEQAETMPVAIEREKQLKNWHRPWKVNLIEALNPDWRDLYNELAGDPETSSV